MIEVLQANPVDAAVLAKIHARASDAPWDAVAIADLLEKPNVFGFLALYEGAPAGFVLAQAAGGEAEILNIATDPACQRKGVGRAMVISVAQRLESAGLETLFLEVAADNAPAQALYGALGFAEAGRRPGYYKRPGGAMDALLLRLNLVETHGETN